MKTQTTTRQTYRWIWVALAITGLLSACGEDVAVSSGESLSLEQAALQDVSTSSVKISASGATVTFKLEGLHALPSDLRLRTLALRGMELRFTPVDDSADREELIIALEDLLFDVQDGELRIESPIDLPAPGLYQVRMQARSDSSSKEEQGESSGLSFSGWMNPAASAVPFDVRVFGDMRGDGPTLTPSMVERMMAPESPLSLVVMMILSPRAMRSTRVAMAPTLTPLMVVTALENLPSPAATMILSPAVT